MTLLSGFCPKEADLLNFFYRLSADFATNNFAINKPKTGAYLYNSL